MAKQQHNEANTRNGDNMKTMLKAATTPEHAMVINIVCARSQARVDGSYLVIFLTNFVNHYIFDVLMDFRKLNSM